MTSIGESRETTSNTSPWPRKRKRNNSSASLPDSVRALESSLISSPKHAPPPQSRPQTPRLSTPPRIRAETPPPSVSGAEQKTSGVHSPVVEKILDHALASGSSSPRTIVARRLSTMSIKRNDIETEHNENMHESSNPDNLVATSDPMSQMSLDDEPIEMKILGQRTISTSASAEERPEFHRAPSSLDQPPKKRLPPTRGIKSPPPKGSSHRVTSLSKLEDESSSVPLETFSIGENWFDLSTLTWKDSEITGHLMLDPEDDGEGINGIGFRPTPTMAVDRSRRRKQQLTAWRTREEREERERRAKKRQQGRALFPDSTSIPSLNLSTAHESVDKKSVRFSV